MRADARPFESFAFHLAREIRLRVAVAADASTWAATWRPTLLEVAADDKVWDWRAEIEHGERADGRVCVAAESATGLEGMLSLSIAGSRLPPRGSPILYVEYVAVAPWNRAGSVDPRRIRGIGTALVAASVRYSMRLGFEGRIGLHSKPEVETFYRERLKLVDLGPEVVEDGKWVYFEATPEVARRLV